MTFLISKSLLIEPADLMAVAFLPVIGAIMRLVACKAWWPFGALAEGSVHICGRILCAE
ncbi:hypothetical protein [Plesiomonas shigelloides]|uniref:hypothetical protein n=1 Tax=Plesiomonas shigelloides TaxID=703 RepID=UPI0015A6B5E2|nr:hypothetical protein [Plesiomonas shigelloides]